VAPKQQKGCLLVTICRKLGREKKEERGEKERGRSLPSNEADLELAGKRRCDEKLKDETFSTNALNQPERKWQNKKITYRIDLRAESRERKIVTRLAAAAEKKSRFGRNRGF